MRERVEVNVTEVREWRQVGHRTASPLAIFDIFTPSALPCINSIRELG